MKNSVVATVEIEPHKSLGPIDAPGQVAHRLFQCVERPSCITLIGPRFEVAFWSMLVMKGCITLSFPRTQLRHRGT